MLFLFLLLFPFIEIYVLFKVGASLGLLNTLIALIASALLGAGLARLQGSLILRNMQIQMVRGEAPSTQAIHGLLVFLGGLLFIIPGFVSDFIALFFVLPGLRHLTVAYVQRKIKSQMASGRFRVFTSGFGAGGPFRTDINFENGSQDFGRGDWERDVSPKVIDVSPISSQTETPDDRRDD